MDMTLYILLIKSHTGGIDASDMGYLTSDIGFLLTCYFIMGQNRGVVEIVIHLISSWEVLYFFPIKTII